MTIDEALSRGIKRIKLSVWSNPNAYLRISSLWRTLFDDIGQRALGIPVGSQSFLKFKMGNGNDWEEYFGEKCIEDNEL
jgi:hypothetical protein